MCSARARACDLATDVLSVALFFAAFVADTYAVVVGGAHTLHPWVQVLWVQVLWVQVKGVLKGALFPTSAASSETCYSTCIQTPPLPPFSLLHAGHVGLHILCLASRNTCLHGHVSVSVLPF